MSRVESMSVLFPVYYESIKRELNNMAAPIQFSDLRNLLKRKKKHKKNSSFYPFRSTSVSQRLSAAACAAWELAFSRDKVCVERIR